MSFKYKRHFIDSLTLCLDNQFEVEKNAQLSLKVSVEIRFQCLCGNKQATETRLC